LLIPDARGVRLDNAHDGTHDSRLKAPATLQAAAGAAAEGRAAQPPSIGCSGSYLWRGMTTAAVAAATYVVWAPTNSVFAAQLMTLAPLTTAAAAVEAVAAVAAAAAAEAAAEAAAAAAAEAAAAAAAEAAAAEAAAAAAAAVAAAVAAAAAEAAVEGAAAAAERPVT